MFDHGGNIYCIIKEEKFKYIDIACFDTELVYQLSAFIIP
nr:MAG TPA: hypothetical protein [Herelleviridae sp.]